MNRVLEMINTNTAVEMCKH